MPGFAGISPLSLILILAIVILLFGTKKLRNVGQDLGAAVKSFRQGLEEGSDNKPEDKADNQS